MIEMPEHTIDYEMTDALMSQAVREDCMALASEHVSLWDITVISASAAVFALAVARDSHWLWWIAGAPPAIFALLTMGWLFAFLWLPRHARSRLAHLPNRHVKVEASSTALAFQTATERLEVAWGELKTFKRRPNFWVIGLRSGARFPIPGGVLSKEAVSLLEAKLATYAKPVREAG